MNRSNIEKIANSNDEKLLLAKIWDKINAGIQRNIPANSAFLTLYEMHMARQLFRQTEGIHAFGGYPDAARKMLITLPDYLDESYLYSEDSPIVCLRATFYDGDCLTHRDFLGALMGSGISRESVGDICVGKGTCDFFVTAEIAPYLLQSFSGAGRTKVRMSSIALTDAIIPIPEIKLIKDTVVSLRLDSLIASGFSISRSLAVQYISGGKVSVDGLPCEKSDKNLLEGAVISVRGLGKIKLQQVNGLTKKGRISILIHRYL